MIIGLRIQPKLVKIITVMKIVIAIIIMITRIMKDGCIRRLSPHKQTQYFDNIQLGIGYNIYWISDIMSIGYWIWYQLDIGYHINWILNITPIGYSDQVKTKLKKFFFQTHAPTNQGYSSLDNPPKFHNDVVIMAGKYQLWEI